jgi:hypothetical protein
VELERLQRSPSFPAGLARRARVVLLMADKVSGAEIARMGKWGLIYFLHASAGRCIIGSENISVPY